MVERRALLDSLAALPTRFVGLTADARPDKPALLARMIRTIVDHPGIEDVAEVLRMIDVRAREAQMRGHRFDFIAAYDAEILAPTKAIGLLSAVASLLRPGVQLTLQTKHREIFVATTSVLNRLAAYLTMKACKADVQCNFCHVHCSEVELVTAPPDRTYEALHWIDCAGTIIGADSVIIRRGPDRAGAREAFADLLSDFDAAHSRWLELHGESVVVPWLSPPARALFEIRAREANVPLPRHVQAARAVLRIERVQVRPTLGSLRWSGTMAAQDMAAAWNSMSATGVLSVQELADRVATLEHELEKATNERPTHTVRRFPQPSNNGARARDCLSGCSTSGRS